MTRTLGAEIFVAVRKNLHGRRPALFAPRLFMALSFRKSHVVIATAGAMVAVSALAYAATNTNSLMLLGSFGASALLLFALPEAPLSQPRPLLLGHLSASVIALICLAWFGPQWWAIGIGRGWRSGS
jgi:CBS-domain-containing membrane protein